MADNEAPGGEMALRSAPETAAEIDEFLDHPETGVRRTRPSPDEVAAADKLTALTEELGLYGEG